MSIINLENFPFEFWALIVSLFTLLMSLYIADRARGATLRKELFFKKQQIAEEVVSACLQMSGQATKIEYFLNALTMASKEKGSTFIDTNDTFNMDDFNRDARKFSAFIQIYFKDIGVIYNETLDIIGRANTELLKLYKKYERKEEIDIQKLKDYFEPRLSSVQNNSRKIVQVVEQDLKKAEKKLFR